MLQVIFAVVILVSGVAGWFYLPFWCVAVIRVPSDVRRARVRRMGTTDVQIAFRCDTADGAARGVKAILMRAFELDVTENGMVIDRPMAAVEVDTTPLNDSSRRADATSSPAGGPSPGRPLDFEAEADGAGAATVLLTDPALSVSRVDRVAAGLEGTFGR